MASSMPKTAALKTRAEVNVAVEALAALLMSPEFVLLPDLMKG